MVKTDDIAPGSFLVSGGWYTVSGATIEVVRAVLDASNVPKNSVVGFLHDGSSYVVLGRY